MSNLIGSGPQIEKNFMNKLLDDLKTKYQSQTPSSVLNKFLLTAEKKFIPEKALAYISDSLFGRPRDVNDILPDTAFAQVATVSNLCNVVFKDTKNFGSSSKCTFVKTFDLSTRINVNLTENADYKSGMTMVINPVFYRSPGQINSLPLPLNESTIELQPHTSRKYIDMDLKVNQAIMEQLGLVDPVANCFSGV